MNWLKSVAGARTIDDLLAVVNEYLLQQSDDFWSWIPRDSRPQLVATEEELHLWQRRLAEQVARIEAPNLRMQDLCVFFLRASARALEIRSGGSGRSSNEGEFRRRNGGST